MQNRLKTISFFIKTGFSFAKNSLESYSGPGCLCLLHPGVWEVQTRIFGDSYRRCRNVYLPCQRHFYVLFLHLIRRKKAFFQMVLFGAMAVFVSCKHKQHITRHINKSTSKKHDRYIVLWSRSAYSIYGSYFSNLRLKEERTRQLRSSRPIHLRS